MKTWLIVLLSNFYFPIPDVRATCYFPPEFQGEYKMQNANSMAGVQYSVLNITANAIPIWGNCHRRFENTFMLMISYGGQSCIRCLHLKLRSKNVLQVQASSEETISKCYTNEKTAKTNCPSEESLQKRTTTEILLFKTKDAEGKIVPKEYCPIDGKFSVKYKVNDKLLKRECSNLHSSLDSCPSGSTLNIHLRRCTFDDYDLKLDCLGHWDGPNGETYLGLLDNRIVKDQKPQYRCALYKQDSITGVVHLSIGKDSTCVTELDNSTHGYESYILTPQDDNEWPPEVTYSQCSFPEWMVGKWEHSRIEDNTFIYKDHTSFKTYTIKCVGILDSNDKYLVFSMTQCNEEQYNCMRIQKKSNDIMEFQLGTNFSSNKDVYDLCSNDNFQENSWITQGRLDKKMETSCPISGEFTGIIPDTTELCAKLWSDCRAPELMYYQVSDCVTTEIYEERQYRCLGHWREGEFLYTYTQRRDIAAETYECFVGTIISANEDIYIKEAGEHCQRGINPFQYGMKLIKQGLYSCMGRIPSTSYTSTVKALTLPPTLPTTLSTKPWNIESAFPTIPDIDNNSISDACTYKSRTSHIFLAFVSYLVIKSYKCAF